MALIVMIAGCAPQYSYPAPKGKQVVGEELRDLISGAIVYGRSHKTHRTFEERHHKDGKYEITYAPAAASKTQGKKYRGTWRVDGDKICYSGPELEIEGCSLIFRDSERVEFVDPANGKAWTYSDRIEYENAAVPPVIGATPTPDPVAPKPKPSRTLKFTSSGSGFIISNKTFVLTNNHVIKGCAEVTVSIDNRDIRADVRARDQRNDLALLRLPAGKYPTVTFRSNDGLYPGDSVVAIGYPLSDVLASEGNVSVGIVSALSGVKNNASRLQISAPIQPGNSGGPLFDSSGNVVGVIVSVLGNLESDKFVMQNVNFAIKSTVAMLFMQASGVDYKTLKSTKELRTSDVARKGRPATVFIKCWR